VTALPQGAPQAFPEDCATLQAAAQLFRKYDAPQANNVHIHLLVRLYPNELKRPILTNSSSRHHLYARFVH
jgi:hypothetical protein